MRQTKPLTSGTQNKELRGEALIYFVIDHDRIRRSKEQG